MAKLTPDDIKAMIEDEMIISKQSVIETVQRIVEDNQDRFKRSKSPRLKRKYKSSIEFFKCVLYYLKGKEVSNG